MLLEDILNELKKINEKLSGATISYNYYEDPPVGISNTPEQEGDSDTIENDKPCPDDYSPYLEDDNPYLKIEE